MLDALNQGQDGLSQIGKFITVYPNDDAQAVRLAVALDEVTRGHSAPNVPSDRPLMPGSQVHYRYGGFSHQTIQTAMGHILPAIRSPNGELVPDHRLSIYQAPKWTVDPFIAAGAAFELPALSPIVGERYLLLATLSQSPRSRVHLGIDIVNLRRCIIKQAGPGIGPGAHNGDSHDRLRHEADVLTRLGSDPRFPTPFDLIKDRGESFLIMEDLEAETLSQYVAKIAGQGRFMPSEQVVRWGRELAAMMGVIHAAGFVYQDLKSTNVVVAPDSRLRLIDFDIAQERGAETRPYGLGTPGYMSPQQADGGLPAVTDDIYGIGALLYFMATGSEPAQASQAIPAFGRPLALINPTLRPSLVRLIEQCLDPDPTARFPSMAALDAELALIEAEAAPQNPAVACSERLIPDAAAVTRQRYRHLARLLGDMLCTVARREPGRTTPFTRKGLTSHDLNTGVAGIVLALADLAAEFGGPEHISVLNEGARWLVTADRPGGDPLAGLYVGEAGVGAALLRAGQVLNDRELISAAAAHSEWIASLPFASPDLFHGTAGRARFHLLLWDETDQPEQLRHAVTAGESLLATADGARSQEAHWQIPPGYDGLSGSTYLGYAHGTAGIADVLLDLYDATGQERFLVAAQSAGRWLARLATPALDDGSGLDWPAIEGGELRGGFWCHGAAGVGRFFLHAAQLGVIAEASGLAARAARTVIHGTRWCGPTPCHGLAGNIEFILDMARETGDDAYLTSAQSLAHLLESFVVKQDGTFIWSSESPATFNPQYMVGYAGVAMCLFRLSDPTHRPHQLSRSGFRHKLDNL